MAASKAQHMFEDIAAKAKKAFSEDEMLRSRNDDDSRLDALSQQLGLSAAEVEELRATRHPESRKQSYDQQAEERASPQLTRGDSNVGRLRTMTSPDLRAARNQEEKAAAEARAAELRVDQGSANDVQGDEEGITSVPVRKFQSLSTKEKIWAIMDDPTSSRAAQIVAAGRSPAPTPHVPPAPSPHMPVAECPPSSLGSFPSLAGSSLPQYMCPCYTPACALTPLLPLQSSCL